MSDTNVSFHMVFGNKSEIENKLCISNTIEFHIKPNEYGNLTNFKIQTSLISKLTVCASQLTSYCRSSKKHYHNWSDKSSSAHVHGASSLAPINQLHQL